MITLDIEALSSNGEGIARHEGIIHFVPRALPGERCDVEVVHSTKTWRRAHVRRLVSASSDRVEPPCPIYHACGGCQLQHMAYAKQLEFKRDAVRDVLRRVGHIDVEPDPTVPSDPFGYRRKISFTVDAQADPLVLCLHRWDDPTALVRVERCPLLVDELNAVLPAVETWLNSGELAWCRPTLRRVVLRHGVSGYLDERPIVILACDPVPPRPRYPDKIPLPPGIAAAFCTRWLPEDAARPTRTKRRAEGPAKADDRQEPSAPRRAEGPVEGSPGRKPRVHDGQHEPSEPRRGDRSSAYGGRILEGAPAYHIGPVPQTPLHPGAFAQANAEIARRLYRAVVEMAADRQTNIVDAYCGVGALAGQLGREGHDVTAIESNKDAVAAARRRIEVAGLRKRVIVRRGRVEELLPDHLPADLVVLDPPRAGCHARVIRALVENPPARIAYISCHPAAFARDARRLLDGAHSLDRLTPYDMFPQTYHVELLALLTHHPGPSGI